MVSTQTRTSALRHGYPHPRLTSCGATTSCGAMGTGAGATGMGSGAMSGAGATGMGMGSGTICGRTWGACVMRGHSEARVGMWAKHPAAPLQGAPGPAATRA